jgi:hypothetical protein
MGYDHDQGVGSGMAARLVGLLFRESTTCVPRHLSLLRVAYDLFSAWIFSSTNRC